MPGGVSVAVFGDAMIDYVVDIDSRSALDEKHAVTRSTRRLGGSGANAAAAITAICGTQSARLFATVSDDEWGRWIVTGIQHLGIDTIGIRRVAGPSPHTVIVNDAGQRHLLVDRGVADEVVMPPAADLEACQVVYVSNPVACLARLEVPCTTTLAIGVEHQMVSALSDATLNRASVLITNAAGWSLLQHRALMVPIAETRGELGVRLHRSGSPVVDVAGLAIDVADSTGAGDAFAGAVCGYLAQGSGLVDAVRLANAVASIAVATPGSHLGPIDSALVERLRRQGVSTQEVPHRP